MVNTGSVPNSPSTVELLRLKRTQAGLSARALSLAAGQSGSYVSKVEAGTLEPSLKGFSKLATVLNLTPLELLLIVHGEAR
jgi:transcriptional regulator with XRE-family HTH domain